MTAFVVTSIRERQMEKSRPNNLLLRLGPKHSHARAAILLACFALAACSQPDRRTEDANINRDSSQSTQATPISVSPTASPTPEVEPLKVPERVASGAVTESGGGWNKAVESINYLSSADNTRQPMMFYKPTADSPRPLLVGLHSWSEDYTQEESAIYAEWCIANDWIFIHPNFRGPNVRPEATGSDLVIGDVLSAIEYARANARVDESRIYAVGWSGGGYLGLLLAGREPQIWAGVSAWVPISDLNAWYEESRRLGTGYAAEIAASCGGAPVGDSAAQECRKRSPLTYLENARDIPLDINHGIRDGRSQAEPVPIGQSFRAFNLLAPAEDDLTEEEIEYFTREKKVPPNLEGETADPSHGGLKILFRRQSGNARVTIFDGGHDKNTEAAFRWLNQQRKGR